MATIICRQIATEFAGRKRDELRIDAVARPLFAHEERDDAFLAPKMVAIAHGINQMRDTQ